MYIRNVNIIFIFILYNGRFIETYENIRKSAIIRVTVKLQGDTINSLCFIAMYHPLSCIFFYEKHISFKYAFKIIIKSIIIPITVITYTTYFTIFYYHQNYISK